MKEAPGIFEASDLQSGEGLGPRYLALGGSLVVGVLERGAKAGRSRAWRRCVGELKLAA
jgi:hypothetical protein